MTNTLLTIIAALLAVRIVLQLRQGKKMYQATSEVENTVSIVLNEKGNIVDSIRESNKNGYELVQVVPNVRANNEMCTLLFFTRKKIKNYYEE